MTNRVDRSDKVLWCNSGDQPVCIGLGEGLETGVVVPPLHHSTVVSLQLADSGFWCRGWAVVGNVARLITPITADSHTRWKTPEGAGHCGGCCGWGWTWQTSSGSSSSASTMAALTYSLGGGALCCVDCVESTPSCLTASWRALPRARGIARRTCWRKVSGVRKAWRASSSWAVASNWG